MTMAELHQKSQPVSKVQDKRARIEAAIRDDPEMTNSNIARKVGAHRALVGRVRSAITNEVPYDDKRGVVAVPSGKLISALCSEGVALEAGGMSPEETAPRLGLSRKTYRCARDVFLLATNPNLNAADRVRASAALAKMDQSRRVISAYDDVIDLIKRMWGMRTRSAPHDARRQEKIIENYMHGVVVFAEGANRVRDLDVPYLSETDRARARDALKQAKTAIEDAIKHLNGGVR